MTMSEKIKGGAVIIDREKIQGLLKERQEILLNSEKEHGELQQRLNQFTEQIIGLRHRINELTELLK